MVKALSGQKVTRLSAGELLTFVSSNLPGLIIRNAVPYESDMTTSQLGSILRALNENETIENKIEDSYDDHRLGVSGIPKPIYLKDPETRKKVRIGISWDPVSKDYDVTISTKGLFSYHPQLFLDKIPEKTNRILYQRRAEALKKRDDYLADSHFLRETAVDLIRGNKITVYVPVRKDPDIAYSVSILQPEEPPKIIKAEGLLMKLEDADRFKLYPIKSFNGKVEPFEVQRS